MSFDNIIQCYFRHLKSHIKEQYINAESLDDNSLLMQYFRKHDTDSNMKLDGLELMKALARMEGKFVFVRKKLILNVEADHHDDDDGGHPGPDGEMPVFDILEIIPIVDTILREDDKVENDLFLMNIICFCRTKMDTLAGQSSYPNNRSDNLLLKFIFKKQKFIRNIEFIIRIILKFHSLEIIV